jgi:hypothetical protein
MPKTVKDKTSQLPKEHWKEEPDEHDYPAAGDYLGLILEEGKVASAVHALSAAAVTHKKAKDLLRASRLQLLPADNPAVARDLDKVRRGQLLSPVLLLRGRLGGDVPLTIADGYHRVCASYHIDEDADIPCRIADNPG